MGREKGVGHAGEVHFPECGFEAVEAEVLPCQAEGLGRYVPRLYGDAWGAVLAGEGYAAAAGAYVQHASAVGGFTAEQFHEAFCLGAGYEGAAVGADAVAAECGAAEYVLHGLTGLKAGGNGGVPI